MKSKHSPTENQPSNDRPGQAEDSRSRPIAIRQNIFAGHTLAVICAVEWIGAGFCYPLILTLLGVQVNSEIWRDFVFSHTLAGITITSLTFFIITLFSIRAWLPDLIRDDLAESSIEEATRSLGRIDWLVPLYQLVAISIPSFTIAILVILDDVPNKFALRVITLLGLVSVPFAFLAAEKIRSMSRIIADVFSKQQMAEISKT